MTDAERNSYENLTLLCPNCHNLIDNLEPAARRAREGSQVIGGRTGRR